MSANLSLPSVMQSQRGGITFEHDLFSTASRPALELIQLTSRAHSEGANQMEREANHSPPSNTVDIVTCHSE